MSPPYGDDRRIAAAAGFADIDQVWEVYREELRGVERHIAHSIDSSVPVINQAAAYLFRSGGKRIRPLLLILSARLCNNQNTHEHEILLASAVEYIHTAALLHDDVLDEAALRRGQDTARLLWGNKASILVGDYLYTRAVDQVIRLGNMEIETTLAEACRKMVEGEMLQFSLHHNLDITETDCLTIIDNKTAALISTACVLGAILGGATATGKQALAQFGRHLGMAFQVADDALDYAASPDKLGKTIGKDLHEGKITLPLLHLLSSCTPEERDIVQRIITEHSGSPQRDFGAIIRLMERYGSVSYALGRSRHFASQAVQALQSFPSSPHRDAMEIVADYVVTRDH
jgi:octaprenyl-diphosphate synthase